MKAVKDHCKDFAYPSAIQTGEGVIPIPDLIDGPSYLIQTLLFAHDDPIALGLIYAEIGLEIDGHQLTLHEFVEERSK